MNTKKNKKLNRFKRLRVIQITGFRGILSAIFVVTCLAAGFIGFPSFVIFKIWNHFAISTQSLPVINLFQGLLLWGIFGVSYLIINEKKKYLVALEPKTVSGKDIRDIIKEIKQQSGELADDKELSTRKQQSPGKSDDSVNIEEGKDKIYEEK